MDSPKGKEETKGVGKTWKGKMVKKFKRYGSSSTAPVEISGTFGVPLELCPPSTFNEVSFQQKFGFKTQQLKINFISNLGIWYNFSALLYVIVSECPFGGGDMHTHR